MAKAFLDAYQQAHPADTITTLDLWQHPLPEFDGDVINAKYAIMHGQSHTAEQKAAWVAVEREFQNFAAADKYVFSLPMWNFGVPYKLKHYIDVIAQPGLAFKFTPGVGYEGLVTGKPAAAIYARGGAYQLGTGGESLDFQQPYLNFLLTFIGFTNVTSIVCEPMLADNDAVAKAKDAALAQAKSLAATW